jgi:hypothetical protein
MLSDQHLEMTMRSYHLLGLTLVIAFGAPAFAPVPVESREIRIQIISGHEPHHRYVHYDDDDIPLIRTTYPDGRVVERYGYPSGRREVLVLPAPIIIQQRVIQHPPVFQPSIEHQRFISPIPSGETYIPRQMRVPRLLHGRQVESTVARVVGIDTIGREGPGNVYDPLTQFVAGQSVLATRIAGGGDGYDWFLIASPEGQQAWIRGDRLSFFERSR